MRISLNWLRDFVDLPEDLDPRELAETLSLHVVEVEGFERQADQFANMVVGRIAKIRRHPNADRLKVCIVDIDKPTISNFQFPISNKFQNSKSQIIEVVCGAQNVYEGMLVAVALPGAKVKWHGEGELVELRKTTIRGVESNGMICAGDEIGLEDMQKAQPVVGDGPQILDLDFHLRSPGTIFSGSRSSDRIRLNPQKLPRFASVKWGKPRAANVVKPGTPLAQALGRDDVVFEISNVSLSNRPDLWSHIGIAREAAVIYGKQLRVPVNHKSQITNHKQFSKFQVPSSKFQVRVEDKKLCPRYIGALVHNVHLKETPDWMKRRLEAVGQRLINPLVDISNYVMFEMGQPVHIFDSEKLKVKSSKLEIVVRRAKKGEKLKTLDGAERELDENVLVIADSEKPIAIAGVMGGLESGVDERTNSIVIECATFDAVSVRRTSARLGLKTDASQRFEKALDPNLPAAAMIRALQLIEEGSRKPQATHVQAVIDVHGPMRDPRPIAVTYELIERRIGMAIPQATVRTILGGLGFGMSTGDRGDKGERGDRRGRGSRSMGEVLLMTPPSWRATRDVSIPEDIVEEVARHMGYNRIPDALPSFSIAPPPQDPVLSIERVIKRTLVGLGFTEVEHKPFVNPRQWEKFGLETGEHVAVINPVRNDPSRTAAVLRSGRISNGVNPIDPQEARFLRHSLIPSLLEDIKMNRGERGEMRLFEWGKVFIPIDGEFSIKKGAEEKLPHQPVRLTMVMVENIDIAGMLRRAKGIAAALLKAAGFNWETAGQQEQHPYFVKGSHFGIFAGVKVGEGGIAAPAVTSALDLDKHQSLGVVTIDVTILARQQVKEVKFNSLPLYPSVKRDLAIVVKEDVPYQTVSDILEKYRMAGGILADRSLFDVFRGQGIPHGYKSFAFHLIFRHPKRTLEAREADVVLQRIIAELRARCGAEARV